MENSNISTFEDISEFEASYQTIALNTNMMQLERGKPSLLNQNLYLHKLTLRHFRVSHAIYEEFTIEPGWTTLVLTPQGSQKTVWNGLNTLPSALGILRQEQDHEVAIPAGWDVIEVDIANDLLVSEGLLPEHTLHEAANPEKGLLRLSEHSAQLARNQLQALLESNVHKLDISPGSMPALILRRQILDILGNALDSGCRGMPSPPAYSTFHTYKLVRDARLIMDAQLIDTPSIESVAQELRVTTRTLQRSFTSVLGTTPKQYLLARKLDLARQRLRRVGHSTTVIDVAHEFGFSSSCRFIEHYHRHFGHTPSSVLRLSM